MSVLRERWSGLPGWQRGLIIAAAVVGGALVGDVVRDAVSIGTDDDGDPRYFVTPLPVVALGTIIGLTYGLLAVGLVLIYRTNRIINFAHGEIGAFAAAVFGVVVTKWGVPYYLALPAGFAAAALAGATAEVGVVRRLRNAPRIMSVVATLGFGQLLVLLSAIVSSKASSRAIYPQPPWLPTFSIGTLRITPAFSGMLFFAPVVVAALVLFLRRSRYGLRMRAAAANPEAARMAGVFAGRMSSLAWALAGMLSAFSAILTSPTRGFSSGVSFGPGLLLRALVGAVLARMTSLPQAMAAGVGLGVLEQLLFWNVQQSGVVELALFVIILGALLLQRQRTGRDEEKGSWAAVRALRPVPEALREVWLVRNLALVLAGALLAVALVLPAFITNGLSITLITVIGFSIVGLSVGIVTGLGGQLSLGQFALAGIGAAASYLVSTRTGSYPLALLSAGVVAAVVSLVIGLPALRIRGLMLTVTTLAFAVVTPSSLLQREWLFGGGVDPGKPVLPNGDPIETAREYYYVALIALVVMGLLARNVRRSGIGRLLVAVRDNEDNARAFTVRASRVKVQSFVLGGFIAGIGGATYGHALSRIGAGTFPTDASVDVVAMTVIGGITVLAGPLIGAFYVIGLPRFIPLDNAGLAASSLGALLLILYLPGGIAQLVAPLRDRLVRIIARRRGVDVDLAYAEAAGTADAAPVAPREAKVPPVAPAEVTSYDDGSLLLVAHDLRKHFGGVKAVDGVSLEVRRGETLGLIGPNGAGKTTLFEVLGGFLRPDAGQVLFGGDDVTRLGPERRAELGLIRSFQDAALFPTMTVLESVHLALERVHPTRFLRSAAGLLGSERVKDRRARELVAQMGLDRYRHRQIQELSTGTRRICEIACLIALEPTLLLLDEPSSGIAQRETEALGDLLRELKGQLGVTLVVIEHDIPLIMGLADRVIAMADGQVIASGPPEVIRHDAAVIEAYLGGSVSAIERSGAVSTSRLAKAGPR